MSCGVCGTCVARAHGRAGTRSVFPAHVCDCRGSLRLSWKPQPLLLRMAMSAIGGSAMRTSSRRFICPVFQISTTGCKNNTRYREITASCSTRPSTNISAMA